MKEQFVTYEIAKALKELGFDEECYGYYNSKGELLFPQNGVTIVKDWIWVGNQCVRIDMVLAPLYQQAFQWFRELNDWPIESWIEPYLSENPRAYKPKLWHKGNYIELEPTTDYQTANLNLLRKLISMTKEKNQ